jgi:hypothetical protein
MSESSIFRRVVPDAFGTHSLDDWQHERDLPVFEFKVNQAEFIDQVKILFEIDTFA